MTAPIDTGANARVQSSMAVRLVHRAAATAGTSSTLVGRTITATATATPHHKYSRRSRKYRQPTIAACPNVCCHIAWLDVDHVPVPRAKIRVNPQAQLGGTIRPNRTSIHTAASEVMNAAVNFSEIR